MGRKQKRIMIVSGTYLVLTAVLLIGVSTARFTDSRVAYSSFGAASFNVVILDTVEQEVTDSSTMVSGATPTENGLSSQFGKTVLGSDFTPGMSGTEAKVYPFTVANGTDANNASDVALSYEITIRTTRNLPLNYRLVFDGNYYQASTAVKMEKDAKGMQWYEWSFIEAESPEVPEVTDGTVDNTDNTGTTSESKPKNPVFYLEGGNLDANDHAIVMDWPIRDKTTGETDDAVKNVSRTNSTDYMKEVELLEVLITAASRNNTTQSVETITIDTETGHYYSDGHIVISQSDGVTKALTTYPVDFRAFKTLSGSANADREYSFTVTNGAGLQQGTGSGSPQYYDTSNYKVEIKAPYTTDTKTYTYTLSYQAKDGTVKTLAPLSAEYRLYDEYYSVDNPYNQSRETGYGSYTVIRDPEASIPENIIYVTNGGQGSDDTRPSYVTAFSDPKNRYRLYKVLTFCDAGMVTEKVFTFTNRETVNSETVYVDQKQQFTVGLTGIASTGIPADTQLNNKLQILVDSTFSGN